MAQRRSIKALEREVTKLRREVRELRAELERERARELGIPFTERERAEVTRVTRVQKPRPHKPPKAITVLDVARQFDDVAQAVEFAKLNRIPPHEWAEDIADEFDADIHSLYESYYDTDPATQAAAA